MDLIFQVMLGKSDDFARSRAHNKSYALDTQNKHAIKDISAKIRRLTEIECERLQTVPDNYTNHVSSTQRYRMLGNGWTIDVITHIFSFL
jgi:site-specific DNA-cytosine methylase